MEKQRTVPLNMKHLVFNFNWTFQQMFLQLLVLQVLFPQFLFLLLQSGCSGDWYSRDSWDCHGIFCQGITKKTGDVMRFLLQGLSIY